MSDDLKKLRELAEEGVSWPSDTLSLIERVERCEEKLKVAVDYIQVDAICGKQRARAAISKLRASDRAEGKEI